MNYKLTSLLAAIILFSSSIFSQRKPDYVVTYEKDIESILVNPFTGSVIVKDRDAISSYNPETNETEWVVTDKEVSNGNALANTQKVLDNVQNADFVSLLEKTKDEVNFVSDSHYISLIIDGKSVILNSLTGEVVYNSSMYGTQILTSDYLRDENALLLMVINESNYSCVYYDLENSTQKWISPMAPVESFFSSLKSLVSFKTENVAKDMTLTTEKDIYATIGSTLYKMNKADGKIVWKTDYLISQFALNRAQTHVITIRNTGNILRSRTALNLLDAETGQKVWKDDISTKYLTYLEDNGDKILVAHAGGFNFFNYKDGKKVWKKDAKGNKIKQVIAIGQDYLYVADKEMNLIDKDGKNKWKKFIQICDKDEDEVYHLNLIDNNRVFFLTDAYGNMVDYTSGKKVWKKDVKFNRDRPLLFDYDAAQNVYLAYNDKKVYKFDPNGKDEKKNEPFAKLKKINDDKSMEGLDLFDWGIALVGQSDVVGVTFDGETRYHNTYKEPGGGQRKVLKGSSAVAMGVLGVKSSVKRGFADAEIVTRDENGNIVDKRNAFSEESRARMHKSADKSDRAAGMIGANIASRVQDRFNALKHNAEYAFVFNKAKEGGAELVKVRKSDGEEIDRIAIDGTKPIYEVDEFNDNLYFAKGKELRVYNKK